MTKKADFWILFLILFVSLNSTWAHAAEKPKIIYKSEAQKFSGLKLKGHLKKPELSYIYQRKGLRAEQIVNIPENFNDQIIKGQERF